MQNLYGMYGVLETIYELTKALEQWSFTAKELSESTGISQDTISKNLSRLVDIGILQKIEYREPNATNNPHVKARGSCRQVRYKLKEGAYEFIRNNLY